LRAYRLRLNLRQSEVAAGVDMDLKQYQSYESSTSNRDLRLGTVEKFARFLQVEPWKLIAPQWPIGVADEEALEQRMGRYQQKAEDYLQTIAAEPPVPDRRRFRPRRAADEQP
jgi:transcriptional regulator with XRE-family HTH domain